jgi:hypothetical protein
MVTTGVRPGYRIALACMAAGLADAQPSAPGGPGSLPPLDWNLRARLYARKFTTFQSVWETAPGIALNHAVNSPQSWEQSGLGLARRAGSSYAQYAARETIALAMFAIRKEDPRYQRAGSGPLLRRVGRVLKSAVVARDLNGRDTPAVGGITGVFAARAIANSWLPPEKRTASATLVSGGYGLLARAGGNAVREFWPDVKRRFRR